MVPQELEHSEETARLFREAASKIDKTITSYNLFSKHDEEVGQTVKIALKEISTAIADAQKVLEIHADGSLPVSKDALNAMSELLASSHTAMDEIILFIAKIQLTR